MLLEFESLDVDMPLRRENLTVATRSSRVRAFHRRVFPLCSQTKTEGEFTVADGHSGLSKVRSDSSLPRVQSGLGERIRFEVDVSHRDVRGVRREALSVCGNWGGRGATALASASVAAYDSVSAFQFGSPLSRLLVGRNFV